MNSAVLALLDDAIVNDKWTSRNVSSYGYSVKWKESEYRNIAGKLVNFHFDYRDFSIFTYKLSVSIAYSKTHFKVFKYSKRGRMLRKLKKQKVDTEFEQEVYNHLEEKQSQRVKDLMGKISELEKQDRSIMDEINEIINKKI